MKILSSWLIASAFLVLAPYCYSATQYQCPNPTQVRFYCFYYDPLSTTCFLNGDIQVSNGSTIQAKGRSSPLFGLRSFIRAEISASEISCYYETDQEEVVHITASPGINFANCTVKDNVVACPTLRK